MRRRLTLAGAGAVLALAAVLAAVPAPAVAAPAVTTAPRLTTDTKAPCNTVPAPGFARCFAVVRTPGNQDIAASSQGVTADATHRIQVTPYFQEGLPAHTITKLQLRVSFGSGNSWQAVKLTARQGTYSGTYQVPAKSGTKGTVSLKAEAAGSAGDTVSQIVTDGYAITG